MDRRGFLGIMVVAAAALFAGGRLLGRKRRTEAADNAGLKEAMFYRKG